MNFGVFLGLIFLALLWGPSFLFIKVAVHDIPPFTLAAGRVVLAAGALFLVLRLQGRSLPKFGPVWKHFAVMGIASNALPFVLFCWGEQYIDSALAAILNGTTPIFTIILAHFFTTDDHLTPTKSIGVVLGFAGLIAMLGPALAGGLQATTWGLLAITVAAASYGVAVVYARQNLRGQPPLIGPTAQLIIASIVLVPISLIIEQPYRLPWPAWPAVGSLLTLALLGTALAFVIYYWILERASATFLSMVTYMVPIVGTTLGVMVLNERPGWNAYLGCVLIILGIMVVNGVFRVINPRRWVTEFAK